MNEAAPGLLRPLSCLGQFCGVLVPAHRPRIASGCNLSESGSHSAPSMVLGLCRGYRSLSSVYSCCERSKVVRLIWSREALVARGNSTHTFRNGDSLMCRGEVSGKSAIEKHACKAELQCCPMAHFLGEAMLSADL